MLNLIAIAYPKREVALTQKLTRWGASCGVRIPKPILNAAGLRPGDYVHIRLMDSGDLRLRPVTNSQPAEPLVVKEKSEW